MPKGHTKNGLTHQPANEEACSARCHEDAVGSTALQAGTASHRRVEGPITGLKELTNLQERQDKQKPDSTSLAVFFPKTSCRVRLEG